MSKEKIKLKLGNYELSCIHENGSLRPMGFFSKISSIFIHNNMKMTDFIGELLMRFEKETYSLIKMDSKKKTKKIKVEEEEEPYITIFTDETIDKITCEKIMKKIKEAEDQNKILGSGTHGKVFDLGNGFVGKKEICSKRFSTTEEFIEEEKNQMEESEPLRDAKLIPKIHQIIACDKYCIIIMDKIEGITAQSKIDDLLEDINHEIEIDETDNFQKITLILKNLKFVLRMFVDAIIKFHKIMKDNVKDTGHGDLHLENIMIENSTGNIKFIDLSFYIGRKIEEEWENFIDYELRGELIGFFLVKEEKEKKKKPENFSAIRLHKIKKVIKSLKNILNDLNIYYKENMRYI